MPNRHRGKNKKRKPRALTSRTFLPSATVTLRETIKQNRRIIKNAVIDAPASTTFSQNSCLAPHRMAETRRMVADVIRIISHLGGPDCSEEDLQWAADIPSGKLLLEWLANQGSATSDFGDAGVQHSPRDILDQTVLSSIALYKEELDVLGRARANGESEETGASQSCYAPASYAIPSTLRARAAALESEAEALEARAARLKRRSQLAKSATKDVKQTVSAVQKQIESADQTVQRQEERLTDLSTQTDGTIAKCMQQALALLHTSEQQEDKLATLKSEIASLDRARHAVAGAVGRLYQTLDNGYNSLPSADELADDAATLQVRYAPMTKKDSPKHSKLVDAAYLEELEKLAGQLKASSPGGPAKIEGLLRTPYTTQESKIERLSQVCPDVKAELERAGRKDRLLLLQAQEKGLDEAIREVQESLLPRLRRTHDALHARSAHAAETEAVVSALIEELEDVNDTVESTKPQPSPVQGREDEQSEEILEAAVTDLLKTLLRSDTGRRPTVLLNRSDVEAELAALTERLAVSRRDEGKWAFDVKGRLAELYACRTVPLSSAYENVPMNTSPPFSALPAETTAKEDARGKAQGLTEAAARLHKECELSSKDKQKLAAFIKKWTSESK